jgi:integrase
MVDKKRDSYLFLKRDIWYFSRHVPIDVRGHYRSERIVRSLRTRSHSKAIKTSIVWCEQLERIWAGIRLLNIGLGPSFDQVSSQPVVGPKLSAALATYLKLKGHGRAAHYEQAARRAVDYAILTLGDRPLDTYTQLDAARFRDALFARGLSSSSVKRVFGAVKAIAQLTIAEHGLQITNVFKGTFLPKKDDVRRRQPIPVDVILSIQQECIQMDDDLRWLIALLSDSGMRLAEAVGLLVTDIKLDSPTPHVLIQQHKWRPLKTASSQRTVPLVGASLWAAHRIVCQKSSSYAFSRYNDGERANANHASAALNKWLKPRVPSDCVVHSFRHSLRDRLRAVQCPFDIVDRIGGWTTAGIGHSYGAGYDLSVLNEWMSKMGRQDLPSRY